MMCRIAALPGRFRHVLGLASVGLLAQLLLAHPAYAWWNGDWSYREKIVADATPKGANITQPVGRTQILVRLHSGNFNFATAKDDGSDLRFVAGDDRTPLHYHLEKFDGLIDQVALALGRCARSGARHVDDDLHVLGQQERDERQRPAWDI